MENSADQSGIFIPQLNDLIATNMSIYKTLNVPKLLNFVKNVALLKFSIGNITIAKKIGTVEYKSHTLLYKVSGFGRIVAFLCSIVKFFRHITDKFSSAEISDESNAPIMENIEILMNYCVFKL